MKYSSGVARSAGSPRAVLTWSTPVGDIVARGSRRSGPYSRTVRQRSRCQTSMRPTSCTAQVFSDSRRRLGREFADRADWTRYDSIRLPDRTLAALVHSACNKPGSGQVTHRYVRSGHGSVDRGSISDSQADSAGLIGRVTHPRSIRTATKYRNTPTATCYPAGLVAPPCSATNMVAAARSSGRRVDGAVAVVALLSPSTCLDSTAELPSVKS